MLFFLQQSKKRDNDYHFENGYIKYTDGNIYIGDEDYLDSITELGPYDFKVLDDRSSNDPDLKVYDSYKTINPVSIAEVVDALLSYEDQYPSDWNRSKHSLFNEWISHNIMFYFGYKTHRTTDVDLNNGDEEVYKIKLLK
jgi:hypothetical protein